MADQRKNSAVGTGATLPVEFIALCILAFASSVAATVYFCHAMGGGMDMPGDWKMSMMWMRMNGQSWIGSAADFLLMWLAMMVAMMLPSALPTFLKTRRATGALSIMAVGYFVVWMVAGVGIYTLSIPFAAEIMRWDSLSRAVPLLSGTSLIAAGALQFTRWKMAGLLRCRSAFGCATTCPDRETDFRLGCKQGVTCCLCCAGPMLILIMLGMMNPFVIVGVAIIIAAEKILPRPEITARLVGTASIVMGGANILLTLHAH